MPAPSRPTRPVRPVRPPVNVKGPTQTPPHELKPVSAQSKRSVVLIMLGLPLFLISSVVLYRRVFEGRDKRVQLGEYTPDGGLRVFTPEEKEKVDESKWLTWIFGKDK